MDLPHTQLGTTEDVFSSVGEGQDIFSEGNVETTVRLFETRHKCNHFCEWPGFGLKKFGASGASAVNESSRATTGMEPQEL